MTQKRSEITDDSRSELETTAKRNAAAERWALEQQLERILNRVPPLFSLPPAGQRCRYTDKPRSFLVELVCPCQRNNFRPPVKAIYKKAHRYAQRGVWLLPAENIFRHLLGLAENSTQEFLETAKARAEAKQGKAAE